MTNKIISAVCEYFGITPETLQSKTRKHNIVYARQIVCYIGLKSGITTLALAEALGLSHATVLHGNTAISNYLSYNTEVIQDIKEIENFIT